MKDFSIDELVGTFEKVEENDFKVATLKSQIKMLNDDSSATMKEFAKDKETKPKFVRDGYKHWKEKKYSNDEESEDDDLYTILALVDSALEDSGDSN